MTTVLAMQISRLDATDRGCKRDKASLLQKSVGVGGVCLKATLPQVQIEDFKRRGFKEGEGLS